MDQILPPFAYPEHRRRGQDQDNFQSAAKLHHKITGLWGLEETSGGHLLKQGHLEQYSQDRVQEAFLESPRREIF